MHAFIGADRHRMRDVAKDAVTARRQRLFDQRDAVLGGKGQVCNDIVVRPALIGVQYDAARRCCLSYCADTGHIVVAADLDLEQRPRGIGAGLRRHRFGLAERQRVGRLDRLGGAAQMLVATGLPVIFASRSHSAQSMALRAAPAGMASSSAARLMSPSICSRIASIASRTPSMVSP